MDQEKKMWTTPELIEYGPVDEITGKTVLKDDGSGDDFCNIISTN
jgi:hypothetical protein